MALLNDAEKYEIVDRHLRAVLSLMPEESRQAKAAFYQMLMDSMKNNPLNTEAHIFKEAAAFHDKCLSELVMEYNVIVPKHLEYSFKEARRSRRVADSTKEMKTFVAYDFDNHQDILVDESVEEKPSQENHSSNSEFFEASNDEEIIEISKENKIEEPVIPVMPAFPSRKVVKTLTPEIVEEQVARPRGRRARLDVEIDALPALNISEQLKDEPVEIEKVSHKGTDIKETKGFFDPVETADENIEKVPEDNKVLEVNSTVVNDRDKKEKFLEYTDILSYDISLETKGYNCDEVDDYLEQVLLNIPSLKPDALKFEPFLKKLSEKKFNRNKFFKGYSVKEVDELMARIHKQYSDLKK